MAPADAKCKSTTVHHWKMFVRHKEEGKWPWEAVFLSDSAPESPVSWSLFSFGGKLSSVESLKSLNKRLATQKCQYQPRRWRVPSNTVYLDSELLPRTQAFRQADAEPFLPAELQWVSVLPRQELQRHDAHSHQLVLVQLLKAFSDDCTHPLQPKKNQWGFPNSTMFLKSGPNVEFKCCSVKCATIMWVKTAASLPASTVLWRPSPWSFQSRSLCLPGWWGEWRLSDSDQLPQRHPAEQKEGSYLQLLWYGRNNTASNLALKL